MGLNLDMASMLNIPTTVQCPKCNEHVHAYFDDLDLESGRVNPKPGILQLTNICSNCNSELTVRAIFTNTIKVFVRNK